MPRKTKAERELDALPDIVGVAHDRMSVVRDDDQILVVTHWIDREGQDCDPDEAYRLVAGPSPENKWYTVFLDKFNLDARNQ